jgi:hypothetical protein
MKLQYGILGMVLVSGGAYAHNHTEEVAEGIQVGGYVDARYTWASGDKEVATSASMFSLPEGALYVGKRVGATRVFVDASFNGGANVGISQAFVTNSTDAGLSWKAGIFDTIYGWQPNDSGHYWLSTAGLLSEGIVATHRGLLLGYNFSDMLALHVLVDSNQAAANADRPNPAMGNMDSPNFGVKLESKMDAFDLGLGYYMSKTGPDADSDWALDVVAGTKFADYDFKAIFVMNKDSAADFSGMGFGAQLGGMFTDSISGAARVEWSKYAEDATALALSVGPQFHLEKGFVVKADFTMMTLGGDANDGQDAMNSINLAAVYSF